MVLATALTNFDRFETLKDLHLFVRKLNLKGIHHKTQQPDSGFNTLMQLSMTECQELRDLLNDSQTSQPGDSLPPTDFLSDSQNHPSSPTPLLEALENAVSDTTTSTELTASSKPPGIEF